MKIITQLNLAVKAHEIYNDQFKRFLKGDYILDPAKAGDPESCRLAKILRQWESQFGDDPEFEKLREVHSALHISAGNIIANHSTLDEDRLGQLQGEYDVWHQQLFSLLNKITARNS